MLGRKKELKKKKENSQVGALGVTQSYITVSRLVENILPQFVGKEFIIVNKSVLVHSSLLARESCGNITHAHNESNLARI